MEFSPIKPRGINNIKPAISPTQFSMLFQSIASADLVSPGSFLDVIQSMHDSLGLKFSAPDYRPLKKWAHVLYNATPNAASRKKGVVAIARQPAVYLWRIFTGAAKAEAFGLIYLTDAK